MEENGLPNTVEALRVERELYDFLKPFLKPEIKPEDLNLIWNLNLYSALKLNDLTRQDLTILGFHEAPVVASDTTLIEGATGKRIKVYSYQYESASDQDVAFRFGAGARWARRATKGCLVQTFIRPHVGKLGEALILRVEGASNVRGSIAYALE